MEERILEAVEYITISLDDIKDYQDFIKYKPELIKAIDDIKNVIHNKKQIKENETIENGEGERSKISSILGLQFDYDPLINEDDAKFFSDYDEKNNIRINNNKNKTKQLNNKNKNNLLFNIDTVLNCTESLRNKNQLLKKKKYNNIINNLKKNIKKNNNINNNINNNKIDKSNENKIKKYFNDKRQKEKMEAITDIIIQINSKDYLYKILTKLFGDSLSDKLLTNKISDELLESVQNAIYEIEKINEKYKKINNINEKIEKLYQEKLGIMKNQTKKEEKKEFNINYKYGNDQKNFFYRPKLHKNNSYNKFKYSEPYQEFNFKKSLRNQTPKTIYKNLKKEYSVNQSQINTKNKRLNNISKSLETPKDITSYKRPFISATCGYGKYFDEPLQNGGESKLN